MREHRGRTQALAGRNRPRTLDERREVRHVQVLEQPAAILERRVDHDTATFDEAVDHPECVVALQLHPTQPVGHVVQVVVEQVGVAVQRRYAEALRGSRAARTRSRPKMNSSAGS